MNWEIIRPALKTLIQDLSGLAEGTTVWEDEPRPFNPGALVLLASTAIATLGRDECFTSQDLNQPMGQEKQDNWHGNRLLTLTIKVEALNQTDSQFSYNHLERIRNRLNFRRVGASLRAVNLAIAEIGQTVDLTTALDDRNRSVAALDIRLAARVTVQDPDRYPYIGTVDITGTLQDP